MPFTTDGSAHAGGIENEINTVEYMNSNTSNLINFALAAHHRSAVGTWSHQGGTGTTADATVTLENDKNVDVSIKNHKGSGTFDWLNTTHLPEELAAVKPHIDALRADMKRMKAEMSDGVENEDELDGLHEFISEIAREEVANLFNTYIERLTSENIGYILSAIYANYPEWILINDKANKKYVLIHKSKSNMARFFHNGMRFKLGVTDRAKTSRQIIAMNPDGRDVNTHLRIRFVLNNGVTALLGFSSANRSSTPVIKIQQDDVADFISSATEKTEHSYA